MKKNIKYLILAIFSSLAILFNTNLLYNVKNTNFANLYNINILFISFLAVLLFYVYKRTKEIKITKFQNILTILFSICMIIGECYTTHYSIKLIYDNIFTILLTIIKFIGFNYLFKICFYYLTKYIKNINIKDKKFKNKFLQWYSEKLVKYPFRTSFISILIVFSVYIIAFYPIVLSPDPSFQIKQFFNIPTKYIDWVIQRDPNVFMTNHHPVLQTYTIGYLLLLGRNILNDNFGLFLYTLFQTLIYSSVLAYSIKVLSKNKVSNKHMLIVLLIYLLVPYYAFYTVSAVKDTLYTAFMMLYVIFVYDIIENDKKISINKSIWLFLITTFICLIRNNGLYVIILSIPFLIIYSKKNMFRIGIPILLTILTFNLYNQVFLPKMGISDGSIREALSIPFQQTARYVKTHPDDVTDEEKEIIDNILIYDTLASRYNPELADPVKNEYNKYTTKKELKEYFNIWLSMFFKHSGSYIDATLNNTYGYFYPNAHKWYFYYRFDKRITEDNLVNYHYIGKLKPLREILTEYGNIFPGIPIIGLFASIGFNTWYVFILSSYLTKKNKKYLIVMIPLYISILICFASPANTYFRYTMPYIFMLPMLTMIFINKIGGDNYEKK